LHDALPLDNKTDRLRFLNAALVASRAVEANDHRLLHLGWLSRRLVALGEKERGRKLLREGQAIARELPTAGWGGFARGAFAEDLAVIDLPGALALMEDLKAPFESLRHHANLGRRLAATNPAEAERLVGALVRPGDRNGPYQRD